MIKKILPILIILSAISVSGSAAFYSIYGLSKLFAGASTQVIIMASSLEAAKLIIITLLHQYWTTLKGWLKIYFILAVTVLMIITSAGIYGFLSAAYQDTSNKDKILTRGIELVDVKKNIWEDSKKEFIIEKDLINKSISELRLGISNPGHVEYIDKKTGQKVSTTSALTRKSLENQLDEAIQSRNKLNDKIAIVTDSINNYEIKKVEMINNSESTSELGPLKYLSKITNTDMDEVVNWFLLLIIFVFDPLAIALVLAANIILEKSLEFKKTVWDEIDEMNDEKSSNPIVTIKNNKNTKPVKKRASKQDLPNISIEDANELLDEVFLEKKKS